MCNCQRVVFLCPACKKQTGEVRQFRGHGPDTQCSDINETHLDFPREKLTEFYCPHRGCSLGVTASNKQKRRLDDIRVETQAAFEDDIAAAE